MNEFSGCLHREHSFHRFDHGAVVVVVAGTVVVVAGCSVVTVVEAWGWVVTVVGTVEVVDDATGSTSPSSGEEQGMAARSNTTRAAPANTRTGRGFESSRWVTETSSG